MPQQTDTQLREIVANYSGMISLVDHQVGRILSALEEESLAENTPTTNGASGHRVAA